MSRFDSPREFTMTEDHLKLLADLYIGWNDYAYEGSPGPGDKRPFGNSDVTGDIFRCLGWEMPDEDADDAEWNTKWGGRDYDTVWDECFKRAMAIYRELEFAMAIVLKNVGCPRDQLIGLWKKASIFSSDPWTKVAV